ncbi:glycoside hydrolase family 15 protein [soil metagenome]
MKRIEDYGLIGDLHTSALVDRTGSIDWCCFPRFDSGACFAALLGTKEHGYWSLATESSPIRTTRKYRGNTLILETIHETESGAIRVIDFMPPEAVPPSIVRIVEGMHGTVDVRSDLAIRFDFGRIVPWVRRIDHARMAVAGPDALCLRTPVDLLGENMTTVSEFEVNVGDRVPFVLTWFPSHEPVPHAVDAESLLNETEHYWNDWAGRCSDLGDHQEAILRSLIVLKALTFHPTGGIVAAPTTSLPEKMGGVRNWDYRFCWLRDAAMTIVAMLKSGYSKEAESWREWLLRAVAGDPRDVQIMYGIAGERRLEEFELDWLPGFSDSRPVRVGNAASKQLQLDVFGELMEATYTWIGSGVARSEYGWRMLLHILEWLETGWREPDAGIWEVRGPVRHFTHSKVMAWVAFDRAIRLHDEYGFDGPVERWRQVRRAIKDDVLAHGFNELKQAYSQSYGSDELDASVLLMTIVGFLPPNDARIVSTVAAIREELGVDGLLLRYLPKEDVDGLPGDEGVFLPCSFWLCEVLAMQGHLDEAHDLFDRLLALRNDLGLISEEYDPIEGHMLGNFPQAFTHLALVEAALELGGRAFHARDSLPGATGEVVPASS